MRLPTNPKQLSLHCTIDNQEVSEFIFRIQNEHMTQSIVVNTPLHRGILIREITRCQISPTPQFHQRVNLPEPQSSTDTSLRQFLRLFRPVSRMRVAVVQTDPILGQVDRNIARATELLKTSVSEPVDLV